MGDGISSSAAIPATTTAPIIIATRVHDIALPCFITYPSSIYSHYVLKTACLKLSTTSGTTTIYLYERNKPPASSRPWGEKGERELEKMNPSLCGTPEAEDFPKKKNPSSYLNTTPQNIISINSLA